MLSNTYIEPLSTLVAFMHHIWKKSYNQNIINYKIHKKRLINFAVLHLVILSINVIPVLFIYLVVAIHTQGENKMTRSVSSRLNQLLLLTFNPFTTEARF